MWYHDDMRVGKVVDINYESDTINMYGEDGAKKHFAVDDLIELLLEDGVSLKDLKLAIDDKGVDEALSILEAMRAGLN